MYTRGLSFKSKIKNNVSRALLFQIFLMGLPDTWVQSFQTVEYKQNQLVSQPHLAKTA